MIEVLHGDHYSLLGRVRAAAAVSPLATFAAECPPRAPFPQSTARESGELEQKIFAQDRPIEPHIASSVTLKRPEGTRNDRELIFSAVKVSDVATKDKQLWKGRTQG